MRWHKTGKTRPMMINGRLAGYKKILVLYAGSSKQGKSEKTSWVMHQYHLGPAEEEKDGELVVSKVFYQTRPRQSGNARRGGEEKLVVGDGASVVDLSASVILCKYVNNC